MRPMLLVSTVAALVLTAGPARAADVAAPANGDHLVVLSTSDFKGKTSPCGCHVPKGGLSRWSRFVDSVRTGEPRVLAVMGAGFFPDSDDQRDVAAFVMDVLRERKVDAVGIGAPELRFGRGFLLAQLARTGLPATSANLVDVTTKKPLVAPYRLQKVGGVTVGLFALASDKVDLGVARDSVRVEDPVAAAQRTVAELRKKGATVVVLLSSLGKVESEDLVVAVDGIDLLVPGRNVPVIQKGRLVKNSLVVYGGEQGQFIGVSTLALGPSRKVTGGDAQTVMLGPEVADVPEIAARVKAFEAERKTQAAPAAIDPPGAASH